MDIELADNMPDGWQLWLEWHKLVAPENLVEIQAVVSDRGDYLGYHLSARSYPLVGISDLDEGFQQNGSLGVSTGSSRSEPKRIQICVLQLESQTHRLACQRADAGLFPQHDLRNLVTA